MRAASWDQAREQRVDGADQQVGRIAARDAGEHRRHAQDRMPPGRDEDQCAQRHQQHVADLAGHVRHYAGEHQHGREQVLRRRQHQHAQRGADEAAVLGHADADQGHQHHAQRREAGEVGDCAGHYPVQALDAEQVHRRHDLARGRMRHAQPRHRGEPGRDHHRQRQQREQRRRMGQGIAAFLDDVEEAVHGAALGGGEFGHRWVPVARGRRARSGQIYPRSPAGPGWANNHGQPPGGRR